MSQTLANGIVVPTNPDNFTNLTADLATMGNSANVLIPVANQTARDALTKKAGLAVTRSDLPGQPIQICDGTNWFTGGGAITTQALAVPDAGWVTAYGGMTKVNLASGFTQVYLDLYLVRGTTGGSFTLGTSIGTLWTNYIPTGWRPANVTDFDSVIDDSTATPQDMPIFRVGTDGTVAARTRLGGSSTTVGNSWIFHLKGSWTI